jgi:hypothetical protein
MNLPQIPIVPKPPEDPVARSIAKHDAFMKPASFKGKAEAKSTAKPTRVRTMDWKKSKGKVRKKAFDYRAVKYY